jgi:serine/threonine protein kinase
VSAGPATPVEFAALTLGAELGRGGQGSVHQVRNKRINESGADGGWEVVYKEYAPTALPQVDAAALAAAVALPGRLTGEQGRWLCEKTAWPAAVVRRGGQTCGFLMRAVPDRFHFTLRTLAAGNQGSPRLATLEYLLNEDAYVTGIGLTVTDRDRLLLLADLATTLDRLHRFGVAVGDLSPKNLLFTLTPRPECFLIDCDAARTDRATVLPQAETPDWHVPTGEERATPHSDAYKLALLAVRLFARDQSTIDPAALAAIDPALGALARASLASDPAARPTPATWSEHLVSASGSLKPGRRPRAAGGAKPGGGAKPKPSTGPAALRPRVNSGSRTAGSAAGNATAGSTAAGVGKVLATVAVVVAVLLLVAHRDDSHPAGARAAVDSHPLTVGHTPRPADNSYRIPQPDPTVSSTRPSTPTSPPTPTPSPSPTEPVATAGVGDCFYDTGTSGHADLTPTTCTAGAFKVIRINEGSTDLDGCANVPGNDESVSSKLYSRVLCLSYQSSGGDSYHARQGDCVFGPSGTGPWSVLSCRTGAFKVLAVYRGTGDHSKCDNWPHYNEWRTVSGPKGAGLDVLQCLSMVFPDDAGYATTRECLLKSGAFFTNVGSCDRSNVYVTGRTSTPNYPAFCGQDASTYWRSNEFPDLGYTVCWRWR